MADDRKNTDLTTVGIPDSTRNPSSLIPAGRQAALPQAESVTGIVQQLKEKRIKRRAAVKALEIATSAQLEVITRQVHEASRVKKTEATVVADQMLKELDLQFQKVLGELGVRNEAIRRATLAKINDETARDLREFANKDWPDFMREAAEELVKERWQRFVNRLLQDVED